MTTERKIDIAAILITSVLTTLFMRGCLAERDARNSADAFAKTETAKADALAQQIETSKIQATAYAAGMAKAAASITTPQQAVKIITRYLPGPNAAAGEPVEAPTAIPIIRANELDQEVLRQLPAAPEYAILTPAQTEAIAKNDLACDADRHSLAACSVQLADSAQISAINQAKATKYDQAVKGGTLKQRVGKVLKSAACAGGVAAIAAVATRNSPSSTQFGTVAAGAAGGAIVCSVF